MFEQLSGLGKTNRKRFSLKKKKNESFEVRENAIEHKTPKLCGKQGGNPEAHPGSLHLSHVHTPSSLQMPVDLDSLSPEERRARFRKREAKFKEKKEEPELSDDFDVEQYKRFWTKK